MAKKQRRSTFIHELPRDTRHIQQTLTPETAPLIYTRCRFSGDHKITKSTLYNKDQSEVDRNKHRLLTTHFIKIVSNKFAQTAFLKTQWC